MAAPPPGLIWSNRLDRAELQRDGWDVVAFSEVIAQARAAAQAGRKRRRSLELPAGEWLARVAASERLAVLGARLEGLDDLRVLHGYVLEPVLRAGCALAVESEQRLTRLDPERFRDPEFEYAYTLERALDAAMRLFRGDPRRPRKDLPGPAVALDEEQRRAVQAGSGPVQVIAPAGSGKTAVLVERARALLARGVAADRILCLTFNRDARTELRARLLTAGVAAVEARTFHSLGWWLMRQEGLARARGVGGEPTLGMWRRFSAIALREYDVWVDPADAREAIAQAKLGDLMTAREYRRAAQRDAEREAIARIYALYDRHLVEQGVHDFDDLVFCAVRALREHDDLRGRWQARFDAVLVDEYQDVEPAQELIVRILAAPQDDLFCVGDEDQTLYGWRRASVRRILELDVAYPGIERVSLAHNYRCPPEVVAASRELIAHNAIRFPKTIAPAPGRVAGGAGAPRLMLHRTLEAAAETVVEALAGRGRGEIVVLARTTNLLRSVALACADVGIPIAAPEAVFVSRGARAAVEAYVRLFADLRRAATEDVALVFRVPGRGLPLGGEQTVAAGLREGRSFVQSVAAVSAQARQPDRLTAGATALDRLRVATDAGQFISFLRSLGGLDEHFMAHERAFAAVEQIELEVLEQAESEGRRRTLPEYAAQLEARRERLRAIRDDANGIELTTIHRAKGREWPEVHLFGADEGQLPHLHSLQVDLAARVAGEGLEAERRLAYVAFTRARDRLVIHSRGGTESRFLGEASLFAPAPPSRERRRR